MRIYRILAAVITLPVIAINARLYTPLPDNQQSPTDSDLIAQFRFPDHAISNGAARDMELGS